MGFDLDVENAVKLNKRKPTDELADILIRLFQKSGFDTRNHHEGERQAVKGVTPDNHAMAQVVISVDRIVYTRYNEGQYDLNQQPIWDPSLTGTKYYAFFPRNSVSN
mgnify:CR=1 FL=1